MYIYQPCVFQYQKAISCVSCFRRKTSEREGMVKKNQTNPKVRSSSLSSSKFNEVVYITQKLEKTFCKVLVCYVIGKHFSKFSSCTLSIWILFEISPTAKKHWEKHAGHCMPVSLILLLGKVMEQIFWSTITRHMQDRKGTRLASKGLWEAGPAWPAWSPPKTMWPTW